MTDFILLYSFSRMVNADQKISILLITVNDILNFWIKRAARRMQEILNSLPFLVYLMTAQSFY